MLGAGEEGGCRGGGVVVVAGGGALELKDGGAAVEDAGDGDAADIFVSNQIK